MMKKKRKLKKKRIMKAIVILLFFSVLAVGGVFALSQLDVKKESSSSNSKDEEPKVEEKVLKIIDEKSNSRNIAVMYNNIATVWDYQSGLQDAYLVYEIIVEGGYTRLMAIFKDTNTERIGSVRSSRPYFLDYALENDALYIHYGASAQALSDIKTLGIHNVNGMNNEAAFWRDTSLGLAREHTAFTSMELIKKAVSKYGYRTTTETDSLLNYSPEEIDIGSMEGAISANKIYIDYSASRSTSFEYDSVNKVYLRFQGTAKGNYAHNDGITKKQYTAKNIIVYQVPNSSIDSYGRQKLDNLGGGKGYYITNGYAVPITWEKNTRSKQTVYRYLNGQEIIVNDGNTYIQIQPVNKTLNIE